MRGIERDMCAADPPRRCGIAPWKQGEHGFVFCPGSGHARGASGRGCSGGHRAPAADGATPKDDCECATKVQLEASEVKTGRQPSRWSQGSDLRSPRSSIVSPRTAIDLPTTDQRPSQLGKPGAQVTPRACMAPANTTARRQAAARGSWPPRSLAPPARGSRWWGWTASHRCPEGPKSYFAIV